MEHHVTFATDERLSFCVSDAERVEVARLLARVAGPATALFCFSDEHGHLLVRHPDPGQLAGNVVQALRRAREIPMAPARVHPVRSRRHLENLVPYVLGQAGHHGLATASHPALWPASCFLDLVGARLLPGFGPGLLRELLPRMPRDGVWAAVGLEPVEPAGDELLGDLGFDALVRAVLAATGLPDPAVRSRDGLRARRAMLRLGSRLGFPSRRLVPAVGATSRTARRYAASADPVLDRAIRLYVAIRRACAETVHGRRA